MDQSICLRNTTEDTILYKLMAGQDSCNVEFNPWYLWPQSEINLKVLEKDFVVLVAPVKTSSLLKEQSLDALWDRIQTKSTAVQVYLRKEVDRREVQINPPVQSTPLAPGTGVSTAVSPQETAIKRSNSKRSVSLKSSPSFMSFLSGSSTRAK